MGVVGLCTAAPVLSAAAGLWYFIWSEVNYVVKCELTVKQALAQIFHQLVS